MLADFADGYIAVVYLSTGGTLVLEPDAAPGEGDAAWVPPTAALARREIAVEAGRLVAWPNYAYKHGAGLAAEGAADGTAPRWILGPVALLPGRARLAQSGDCGRAPRLPYENKLHVACGGYPHWLLMGGDGHEPLGRGLIEDFQRIGSVEHLKALAAQHECPPGDHDPTAHTPMHMLCANPHVRVDAVTFVGKLYPAAAAIPASICGGTHNYSHGYKNVLPLHLICFNKSIIDAPLDWVGKLFHAVAALYPAALDAECEVHAACMAKKCMAMHSWPWAGLCSMPRRGGRVGGLKPLDILNQINPSIAAHCSEVVGEIRKISSPEATAMAEEVVRNVAARIEAERHAVERAEAIAKIQEANRQAAERPAREAAERLQKQMEALPGAAARKRRQMEADGGGGASTLGGVREGSGRGAAEGGRTRSGAGTAGVVRL